LIFIPIGLPLMAAGGTTIVVGVRYVTLGRRRYV
jgi:hypothetical protein